MPRKEDKRPATQPGGIPIFLSEAIAKPVATEMYLTAHDDCHVGGRGGKRRKLFSGVKESPTKNDIGVGETV